MKKFTLGVMTGAAALVLAVPLIAQISSAASSPAGSAGSNPSARPVPTQACIQAMAALDQVRLNEFDADAAARNAVEKTRLQDEYNALNSAGSITDDTQRMQALKTAKQNEMNAMKNQTPPTQSAAMQTALQNVKTACGNNGGMGMGRGFGEGMGMMMGGGFGGHGKGGMMGGWFGHGMRGQGPNGQGPNGNSNTSAAANQNVSVQ